MYIKIYIKKNPNKKNTQINEKFKNIPQFPATFFMPIMKNIYCPIVCGVLCTRNRRTAQKQQAGGA